MKKLLNFIQERSKSERSMAVLVRALDRIYNSLATAATLFSHDFTQ